MDKLKGTVCRLKGGPVGRTVRERLRRFRAKGGSSDDDIFQELCFCILTANYTSEGGIRVQEAIGHGFLTLSGEELAAELRRLGYRFPNVRSRHILGARPLKDGLRDRLLSLADQQAMRDWLVANVPGLGMKEASHFLRNIGFFDVAVIDFHVVDVLVEHGMAQRPRTMTRKRYLELERTLAALARACGISQGELDLYLWYLETGKILK